MNKILIDKVIKCDDENVVIDGNKIICLSSGDYQIEYSNSKNYNFTFIVNGDVNLLEVSFDNELDINNRYIINNGILNVYKFYSNKNVNELINIDLCSKGSTVNYKFANICRETEKYEININHIVEETYSNVNNKSISLKNSKLDFIINSNVSEDAIKSVLSQNTRIVTMGECDARISPNMFTPLNDVEAKHGSIIGTFKEDDIFYLMSKGINYNDSVKLLIKGYLLSNINIMHEVRKKIIDIIDTYWR